MGRLFDEYPSSQVYNYELQKKVCMEVHPTTGGYGPIPYSPLLGVFFGELARLSFQAALLLWLSVSLVLYLAGLFLASGRFFHGRPAEQSLIICLALFFWPFIHFFTSGQVSMIGFFALALALSEEDRNRFFSSGLALSVCLYKPTLLLLILPMLVVTRRYRTLVGFTSGALAQVLAVTAVEGPAVWPGYVHMLFSFGSAAATRTQQAFTIYSTYYVDLTSFFSILPGGRSWLGRGVLLVCAGCAGWGLIRAWRKQAVDARATNILVWAATLTWTVVLNTYVGIWDSVIVLPGLIATAATLKDVAGKRTYSQFRVLWLLILLGSWFTTSMAEATGVQFITILFALLATLQLHATGEPKVLEAGAAPYSPIKELAAEPSFL
jgi:hypothetical protein